ncbi:MAG TPA: hypothetical protein PK423_02280 [Clostridiales bacterium]|nr:hypothetical protein [Clostridiales bacterium]HPZ04841.1 hypothetical protein [Clostridiales bacterium]HQD30022.1 hypothetical protein [Clostridiales bacterium]
MDYQKHGNSFGKDKGDYGKARSSRGKTGKKRGSANDGFDNSIQQDPMYDNTLEGKVMNAESLQIDATLSEISKELRPGETLILDIGNNYFEQTDEIYDTLVMRGYDVRKSFRNGRNQIVVSRSEQNGRRRH